MLKRMGYRLLLPFLLLQGIIVIGIVGYMLIEGYSFVEALYMTTLAVTTVGFREVKILSPAGEVFTTFLLIISWGTLIFILARITQFIVGGEINKYFKTRRLMIAIDKLNQHVIVCGFGCNGQQAAHTLKVHGVPFLVVEKREDMLEQYAASHPDLVYILGDDVIEFIDYLSGEEGESINMESVPCNELPEAIKGRSLYEVMTWKKTGVNCIGIKNEEGKFVINPPDTTIILPGMKVIVLGTRSQIQQMKSNLS